MRDGNVDFALDYFAPKEEGFHSRCILTEGLVTLSRLGHPKIGETLSLDDFLSLGHVVLTPPQTSRPMIDLALAKRNLQRRIALTVPHFLSMPVIVQSSNLICTLPRRMAHLYADHFRLKTYDVPLRIPRFPIYLVWHEALDPDPGHKWLRNHVIALCEHV